MTILVTGGAGYIGSVVVRYLIDRGHRVRVLDCLRFGGESLLGVWGHPRFEFLRGDITVAADRRVALDGINTVLHLAALVGDAACAREPDLTRAINLEGTCALVEAALHARVRDFVFVSTCSNYGISRAEELATELSLLNPISLYAETKVAAERAVVGRNGAEFATTVLRLATVYGASPRTRFDLTVNQFARDAVLDKRLVVYGESLWRPYVHVGDVAHAIGLVVDAPTEARGGQIFNVGHTQENYTKVTLVQLLRERVPGLTVDFVRAGSDPRSYRVAFEKIACTLGFQPSMRVPAGLDEIIALVRAGVIADTDAARWHNA